MRRHREYNPDYRDRERRRASARNEALSALARKYPAEFAALYQAELEHAGLDRVQMSRPCDCGGVIERRSPAGRWPARCADCAA
jgi:hypothetical protein